MKKLYLYYLMMFLCIAIIACKKDIVVTQPSSGDLSGYGYLYDLHGVQSTDNSGISVTIDGTSYYAVTGQDGKWTIPELKTGTYNFTITKSGYGIMKYSKVVYTGGGQSFGSTALYPIPTIHITNLADSTWDFEQMAMWGSFSQALPSNMMIHFFFGKTPNISSNPQSYFYNSTIVEDIQSTNFSIEFINLLNSRANYGDTVYAVAYTETFIQAQQYSTGITYYDNSSGKNIYPCLCTIPSNVIKIVVR